MELSSSCSSSCSLSILKWKYDVYLSFRKEDTSKNFTDHLFEALKTRGVDSVRYDQKLERDKDIGTELIHESWCSIVVLSSNYAFSTSCLDELTAIIECKNKKNKMGYCVYPVFYDVDPSDVRKQIGKFQDAFAMYEETFKDNPEMIQKWKAALTELANLRGWHINNRHEADVIKEIVAEISKKQLRDTHSNVVDGLVGIHKRLEQLKEKMCLESNDVRFIGICGMGGVGKTTLARVAYELMSKAFEGKSFLANVRERSNKGELLSLQQQLLSQILMQSISGNLEADSFWEVQDGANMIKKRLCHRKVLIVIDDVDDMEQLNYLAENHTWFGLGSRIVITSRDEHLLRTCGVQTDNIYKPTTLNVHEALRLLSFKAFKSDQPNKDFMELCKSVVEYADGLPLALKVLGSFLYGRETNEWKCVIERLKRDSHDKIFNILRISYDGLQASDKRIFLDIACFFKGEDKNYVMDILESCDFDSTIGISVLIEKSLLTVERKGRTLLLWMHDLLQDMGRKIVEQESPNESGKRSRLWKEDDIRHVLTENTGTEAVESIVIKGIKQNIQVNAEAFLKMRRLRLLIVNNLVFSHSLTHLPSNLRYLDWFGYPLKFLPSSYQPDELVRLNMPCSYIVKLWEEAKNPSELKSIDLCYSQHLIKTPNLEGASNLEALNFERCTQLSHVHPSTGFLKSLTSLNFGGCEVLKSLPVSINGLKSLRTLDLSFCSELDKLPEDFGELECLEFFGASGTAIRELPLMLGLRNLAHLCLAACTRLMEIHPSVGTLQSLKWLSLQNCNSLRNLPSSVNGLKSLKSLFLSGCSMLEKLPEDFGELECLEVFGASGTAIRELPSMFGLRNLARLRLDACTRLMEIHPSFGTLQSLQLLSLQNCKSLRNLPSSVNGLKSLKSLFLSGCSMLEKLPEDFGELELLTELDARETAISELPSMFGLRNLARLHLDACTRLMEIHPSVGTLQSLELLSLQNCKSLRNLPRSVNGLKSLKSLFLSGCSMLEKLPEDLGELEYLKFLGASGTAIRELPSMFGLRTLARLHLDACTRLMEIHPSVGTLQSLKLLSLQDCKSLRNLPSSVNGLKSLESLFLSGCSMLEKLPEDLLELKLLKDLDARETAIRELPSMFGLGNLVLLVLDSCTRLTEIHPSVGTLQSLAVLSLENCKSLRSLPRSINGLKSLQSLRLSGCSMLEKLPEDLGEAKCLEELGLDETAIRELPHSINCLTDLYWLSLRRCKGLSCLLFHGPPSRRRSPLPKGRSLEWLGLYSLKILDLSHCNLLDGTIPNDIGSIFSLTRLNLSYNNFVSLPRSISQLSELEILVLKDCKRLKSLPCLSGCISLHFLDLSNCKRLQSIPELPLSVDINSWAVFSPSKTMPKQLILVNCFNLLPGAMRTKLILVNCFQLMPNRHIRQATESFQFVVPGYEIYEWFSHHQKGNRIRIELPPNLWENGEWMGFAICIVFASNKHFLTVKDTDYNGWNRAGFWLRDADDAKTSIKWPSFQHSRPLSSHCFVLYLPKQQLKTDEISSHFGFAVDTIGPDMEIKECGIRLVYRKDVEELIQSSSTSQHNHCVLMKRSREYYQDGAESGDNGEFEEQPPRKRLKKS